MTYRDTPSMRRLASLPSPLASPEDCAIARVDVERIVGRLSRYERRVIEARMLSERGRTVRETADALGLTAAWVRQAESRALRHAAWEAVAPGSECGRLFPPERPVGARVEVRRRLGLVGEVRG